MSHHHDSAEYTIVTGVPRSGTTMLIDTMGCHPNILAADELFALGEMQRSVFHERAFGDGHYFKDDTIDRELYHINLAGYLNQCREIAEDQGRKFVFKLLDFQCPPAWNMVAYNKNTTVIYIKRDIPLEALVSEKMGHQTGCWHAKTQEEVDDCRLAEARTGPVTVHIAEYLAWLRRIEQLEERLRLVPNLIQMNYSFLTAMPELAQSEIFKRMGLEGFSYQVNYLKVANTAIWERVENYHELQTALRHTAYRHTLPLISP